MTRLDAPRSGPLAPRWLFLGGGVAMVVVMFAVPPIPQDPGYHDFADQRSCLGVPNCLNVASNLPFLTVGLLGLRFLFRNSTTGGSAFLMPAERRPYWLLFGGVALAGL